MTEVARPKVDAVAAIGAERAAPGAVGLVFATRRSAHGPLAALVTGGIPIIRRQIRQLHTLGVDRIVLACSGEQGAAADEALREARRDKLPLLIADTPAKLVEAVGKSRVLAIDEALLVDERMLAAFFTASDRDESPVGPVLGAFDEKGARPAGIAEFPGGTFDARLADTLLVDSLSGLEPASARIVDLSGLDDYAPARRRRLPMVWLPLANEADGRKGTAVLLDSAQKGCLDWPARYFHPPVENLLTRLLLPTPITPNMVSVFVFMLGLLAAWYFATGAWVAGLVLVLVIGPLDGLDGKLARTRLDFSKWGDLEHVADKIVEYLCYICMAAWIGTGWAWAVCALIVLFALAEAVQGEFFRRFTGGQLDDAGRIERAFRLVSGRRNTFMWCLIPFVLLGAWEAGFVMIAAYSVITFFFMQWRFYMRIGEFGRANSPAIDANMRKTAYAFLNRQKGK
ncbi:hypothetical protein C0V78_09470 [Novosphingobium sp. TH158]|nr:hypothetical protein C0V78_09470 [Novosphingobium sp. TH158]